MQVRCGQPYSVLCKQECEKPLNCKVHKCSKSCHTGQSSIFVCVLYCIALQCIVLYRILLPFIVLYYIVLYCIVLYCIVLYCIVLYVLSTTVAYTANQKPGKPLCILRYSTCNYSSLLSPVSSIHTKCSVEHGTGHDLISLIYYLCSKII